MRGQRFFAGVHVFFYRMSKGRIGGSFRGAPVLLLTTTGRRTGRRRTTPLLYAKDGNRLVIVASNGGRDDDPSWWRNLKCDPQAEVEIRGEKWKVKAGRASDLEKTKLWPLLVKIYPSYEDYQRKTKRVISVIVLTQLDG